MAQPLWKDGDSDESGKMVEVCGECEATGQIYLLNDCSDGEADDQVNCPICGGTGRLDA